MKEINANLVIASSGYDGPERRKYSRINVKLLLPTKIKGNKAKLEFTYALNLSAGGVLLETPEEISIGAIVVLVFYLEGKEKAPVELLGRVIRLDRNDNGSFMYGICFQQISKTDMVLLENYIEKLRQQIDSNPNSATTTQEQG